jgi:hypothetical protein
MLNYYTFIYGIDLIIFRIDKLKAKLFLEVLSDWKQYDWGINEHFLLAITNLLNLPVSNLVRYMDECKWQLIKPLCLLEHRWQ